MTDSGGSIDQALAFDPWGLRRDATDWSSLGSPFAGSHETERGYTGHEHLDTVGLVHMNGRGQDPILGRFISADPLIQDPYSTQSHNRYSYVWNNPTSLTDPSGFCAVPMENGCLEDLMLEGYEGFTDWLMYLQDYEMATGISTGFMQSMAHLDYAAWSGEMLGRAASWGPDAYWLYPEGGPQDPNAYNVVYVNGIDENEEEWQALATDRDAAVFYKPTVTGREDFFEAFWQRLAPGADPFAAKFAADMSHVDHPMRIVAYSQGTLTVRNAISEFGFNPSGHQIELLSPAFYRPSAERHIAGNGGSYTWNMPGGDVANIYGSLLPLRVVSGAADLTCGFCRHSAHSPAAPYKAAP